MSWLPDNLFGITKSQEVHKSDGVSPATMAEIQNDTMTTSNAPPGDDPSLSLYESREVAAEWQVPVRGKLHKIEFEHGTTSGKRVLWIDEKEIFRHDWMFKLVGDDTFQLDDLRCVLRVDPAPGFKYKYSLFVDGKPLDLFKQRQAKALRIWETTIHDINYRVVLEKDTLNVFLNGVLREEEGEFTDDGTEMKWVENANLFVLRSHNSGNRHDGLLHTLTINEVEISEVAISDP